MNKNAILVVSFGTSFEQVRIKTIDNIEESIQVHNPEYAFYHAWTSKMILRIIRERDNVIIPSVTEAFTQMQKDGIKNVYVQPTHIIPGIENTIMMQDAKEFQNVFESIQFGNPLLTTIEDHMNFIDAICSEYAFIPKEEAIIFMGHGTKHYANAIYAALDYEYKDTGHENIFVGTVEGYPDLQCVIRQLAKTSYQKIHLIPLMIVAGDHAINDMAGDDEDSWKSILLDKGYDVICHLKGLGEYTFVHDMLRAHLSEILLRKLI